MDLEIGSCNALFPMDFDVTLGAWSWNVPLPVSIGVVLAAWSCEVLFSMGKDAVLVEWSCNVLWWSWNDSFLCCFCLRINFFGDFFVGSCLTGVLQCKGVLNETVLLSGVLVTKLTNV